MPGPQINELADRLEILVSKMNATVSGILGQELTTHFAVQKEIRDNLLKLGDPNLPPGKAKYDLIHQAHQENLEALKKIHTSVTSSVPLEEISKGLKEELDLFLREVPAILKQAPGEDGRAERDGQQILPEEPRETGPGLTGAGGDAPGNRKVRGIPLLRRAKAGTRHKKVYFARLVNSFLMPAYLSLAGSVIRRVQKEAIERSLLLFNLEYVLITNDYRFPEGGWPAPDEAKNEAGESELSGFFSGIREDFLARTEKPAPLLAIIHRLDPGGHSKLRGPLRQIDRAARSWKSTFFSFYEDWRFREEIFGHIASAKSITIEVKSIYSERIRNSLMPEVEKQIEYTKNILGNLPDPETSGREKIRTFLKKELYKLNKEKTEKGKDVSVSEAAGDIPALLLRIENEITEHLEEFREKVGVVKDPNYLAGIRMSDIYFFSPSEFIEFECLSGLRESNGRLKEKITGELKEIVNDFNEYDQIVDFYLDSSISLAEKPVATETEVIELFRDGLRRLLNISESIRATLKTLQDERLLELTGNVENYLKKVEKLDDNTNIINIYTRLLRSRALAESSDKRTRLVKMIGKARKSTRNFFTDNFAWFKTSYTDIRKRLRLDRPSASITSEISNYLSSIQKRIYELPVIYQHLYESAPLRELNLFLSRETEIKKLNNAYANWLNGNFAATLVTGENGSGKSSLLYYYSRTLKTGYKITHFNISGFYRTGEDFYRLINEIFGLETLMNDDDIEAHLSSMNEKRIIILDGIERLFLRMIHGFDCLGKLLSLIVSSNQKIFWIGSVSKYAYDFLARTVSLPEYFDYIINIDTLNSRQIREIVLKRSRISGYQAKFSDDNGSGTARENGKHSQEELEEAFFAELNKFAESNISLSLNYWLQSVVSVDDDHIIIGRFAVPDFDFLESISQEKAFTLLLLVLHGKLSIGHHASICNQERNESYKIMTILKEDSILVKQGEYFTLNNILYRHVVRLLKNRNLIH